MKLTKAWIKEYYPLVVIIIVWSFFASMVITIVQEVINHGY